MAVKLLPSRMVNPVTVDARGQAGLGIVGRFSAKDKPIACECEWDGQ
jgi:hypothetical protein